MSDNEAAPRLNDTLFNPSNLDPSMTPELGTSTSSFDYILELIGRAGSCMRPKATVGVCSATQGGSPPIGRASAELPRWLRIWS